MRAHHSIWAAALLLCGCGGATEPEGSSVSFGFAASSEGWFADGADLDDPPVQWSVAHTTEVGAAAPGAMRLQLENLNDAGKIWIERGFNALPNRPYTVTIAFKLGTSDWGDVNLWRVIAGASPYSPETAADLVFQDDTGNGARSDVGLRWIDKEYTVQTTSGSDRRLWVAIGVWGTYEVGRTYYIDDVTITVR